MVPFSPYQTLRKLGSFRSAYLKRLYDVVPSMRLTAIKPLGQVSVFKDPFPFYRRSV